MNPDNQIFKQLLEEAGINLIYLDDSPRLYTKEHVYDGDLAKLVGLVIKECVDICNKLADDSDSWVIHDGNTCAKQIKERFGFEE
jgi:hypothetical protein